MYVCVSLTMMMEAIQKCYYSSTQQDREQLKECGTKQTVQSFNGMKKKIYQIPELTVPAPLVWAELSMRVQDAGVAILAQKR